MAIVVTFLSLSSEVDSSSRDVRLTSPDPPSHVFQFHFEREGPE